jgi:hypothetical protein
MEEEEEVPHSGIGRSGTNGSRPGITLKMPSMQVIKIAALVCFGLDVVGGAIGIGGRLHLVSLGLALWMLDEVL